MGSEIEACELGCMEGLMNILEYFANVYKYYFMRYSITIGGLERMTVDIAFSEELNIPHFPSCV